MGDIFEALQGKRTKIQAAVLIFMGVGEGMCHMFGGTFSFPEWAYVILGGGTAMSLRAGMQNSVNEVVASVEGVNEAK